MTAVVIVSLFFPSFFFTHLSRIKVSDYFIAIASSLLGTKGYKIICIVHFLINIYIFADDVRGSAYGSQ